MVLKVFPKGDFLGLLICCSQKNSDQVTLKIPFVAISFKSNLRMTGLIWYGSFRTDIGALLFYGISLWIDKNLLITTILLALY